MKIYSLKIVLVGFLFLSLVSKAQNIPPYSFDKSISVPGDGGYDYVSIDDVNKHLFVSHGGSVNVIDLKTEKVIGSVENMKGVHGII
jgi:DNA-binding beta-propeller fold protein YncE